MYKVKEKYVRIELNVKKSNKKFSKINEIKGLLIIESELKIR